ncbi:hypothetical protein ACQ4PT_009886 [Festuca glaucescens]
MKRCGRACSRGAGSTSGNPFPPLGVTGVKGCYNAARFVNFVDNLLLLRHPGAGLESFELDLDERDFDFKEFLPANERRVNLWFRIAFTSTLDFSGCPALIHLRMEDCDIEENISSPFLKHLSVVASFFQTDPVRARICLPGLVSLELTGVLRRAPVLESMPLLVSAIVRLELDCHDNCIKNDYGDCDDSRCWNCHDPRTGADHWRGKSVLLKGLSEVAELELSVDSQVFIVNRDLKLCPTFSKLKTLLLSEWCPDIASDLNVLSCFLKHSPILEKLTLQLSKVPKDPAEIQRSYTPPEQPFALTHLKSVDIKFDEVDGKVFNILRTHGVPLEKVNIQRTKLLDLNVS